MADDFLASGSFRPCVMAALASVQHSFEHRIVTDKGHKSKSSQLTVVEFWIRQPLSDSDITTDIASDHATHCPTPNNAAIADLVVPGPQPADDHALPQVLALLDGFALEVQCRIAEVDACIAQSGASAESADAAIRAIVVSGLSELPASSDDLVSTSQDLSAHLAELRSTKTTLQELLQLTQTQRQEFVDLGDDFCPQSALQAVVRIKEAHDRSISRRLA